MVYTKAEMMEALLAGEVTIDAHTHVGIAVKEYLNGSHPYAMNFESLIVRMKHLGVSHSIVFPLTSTYFLAKELNVMDRAAAANLSTFPFEKENFRLLEEIYSVFPEYAHMAIPFAMFDPSEKAEEQAEALEALISRQPIYGLKTVTSYVKSFVRDFDGKGAAIKEFARKHDLPITFHSSWHPADIWANVFDILALARNNPDLRICLAHSGRFSKEALNQADELPNCFVDTSALKIHCDLALKNSASIPVAAERFDTDYNSPGQVLNDLAVSYPNTIMWGSDTPGHYFFQSIPEYGEQGNLSLKANYDDEISALNFLDAEKKRKVSYKNILTFLFGNKVTGCKDG